MQDLEMDELIDQEYIPEGVEVTNNEIISIINDLQLCTHNVEMLTNRYTDILKNENVVYIMTRISQNAIFMEHFPEFYEKNENGESVINCQQSSPYHRYGVFKHILYTIENVGKESLKFSSHDVKILKWTMLLHDIGKPFAKSINSSGTDSFTGHDDLSVVIADKILDRFDFDEEDKKLIITLIKYHDKYLNEGDLTYDNLSFLANELGDKKDLFYLLIEVKIADNKAKSVEVYNKFMTVVGKYYSFANEYFGNVDTNKQFKKSDGDDNIISETKNTLDVDNNYLDVEFEDNRGVYKEGGSDDDLTRDIIEQISRDVTAGQKIRYYYQPIVDLKKQIVIGFEVFYKIITDQDFSYKQIMRKAKEFDKYDKIQQMLFINAFERFNDLKKKRKLVEYIDIDMKSYSAYVNKARIFSLIEDNDVVFEFNNFEVSYNSKINELFSEIYKRRGRAAIDNFGASNKTLMDVDQMKPKVIKYNLEHVEENAEEYLKKLAMYCVSNSIELIVYGVDNVEDLKFAKKCGIRYVQGKFFGLPTEGLDLETKEVVDKLAKIDEDLIV